MYDVTAAGYQYTDDDLNTYINQFKHIYGLVVPALGSTEGDAFVPNNYRAKVSPANNETGTTPFVINPYDEDINYSNIVDINDVSAGFAVYNARENYMENLMKVVIKADVDKDKMVDISDINRIKKEAHIK